MVVPLFDLACLNIVKVCILLNFADILHIVGGGSGRWGQIATAANSGLASSRNVIMRACTYIKCALAHILNARLHMY